MSGRRWLALVLLALLASAPSGQESAEPATLALPDGEAVLGRVDENIASRSKRIEAAMVIHGRRGTRTVHSRSWIEGTRRSFTEYLNPPRERGTKMLKLDDQLWTQEGVLLACG